MYFGKSGSGKREGEGKNRLDMSGGGELFQSWEWTEQHEIDWQNSQRSLEHQELENDGYVFFPIQSLENERGQFENLLISISCQL